jgi:hypothetical protein
MATYIETIDERKAQVRDIKDLQRFVHVKKSEKEQPEKSWLYRELESAFADVRLMMDGKKKKKTLDELIDELRNSND